MLQKSLIGMLNKDVKSSGATEGSHVMQVHRSAWCMFVAHDIMRGYLFINNQRFKVRLEEAFKNSDGNII